MCSAAASSLFNKQDNSSRLNNLVDCVAVDDKKSPYVTLAYGSNVNTSESGFSLGQI